MRHSPPQPPSLGRHKGLSYALFSPAGEAVCAVVVIAGAGSHKESHFDYGRVARDFGVAALLFDPRGHGDSDGAWGPHAVDDVQAMLDLAREQAPEVALRGSSMGGFQVILGAAADGDCCAVVAICPAPEDLLLRGLRGGEFEFEADVEACEEWLPQVDLRAAAATLGPRTALLLMHAEGDEQVPPQISREIHDAAAEPKRLLLLPGGHHRSIQHDGELQGVSVQWILRHARDPRATG
jgi:uncharacterized protein